MSGKSDSEKSQRENKMSETLNVKYSDLNRPQFLAGFQKLTNAQGLDGLTTYRVAKLTKLVEGELKLAQDSWRKLWNDFFETTVVDGAATQKIREGKTDEAWRKEEQALLGQVFPIPHKLPYSKIGQAKLTAAELIAMEALIEFDVETDEAQGNVRSINAAPVGSA